MSEHEFDTANDSMLFAALQQPQHLTALTTNEEVTGTQTLATSNSVLPATSSTSSSHRTTSHPLSPSSLLQQRQQQEDEVSFLEASSAIVRAIFGSGVGPCWGDFFCTHNRIRGRLYATSLAALFHSNLLGFERRICLRYCEIVDLELYRTTSIRITMFDTETYILRSFNDRVQVMHVLQSLKHVSDRRLQWMDNPHGQRVAIAPGTASDINALLGGDMSNSNALLARPGHHTCNDGNDNDTHVHAPLRRRQLSFSSEPSASTLSHTQPYHHQPKPLQQQQQQPCEWNRRRAVSDTSASIMRNANDLRWSCPDEKQKQPQQHQVIPPVRPSSSSSAVGRMDEVEDFADDVSFVVNEVENAPSSSNSFVQDAWKQERDRILSSADDCVGIESLVLPITLERFYQLFVADGAPYSLDWYQAKYVGDRDIELTGWDVLKERESFPSKTVQNANKAANTHVAAIATVMMATTIPATTTTTMTTLARSMTFTHPIQSTFRGIGPSEARTTRHQRLQRFDDWGMVLQNTTVIVGNIPSADSFYVQDHWIIEASRNLLENENPYITMSTRFGTRFTKRALFRSMIEKSVAKETTKWFERYSQMLLSMTQRHSSENETVEVNDTLRNNDSALSPVISVSPSNSVATASTTTPSINSAKVPTSHQFLSAGTNLSFSPADSSSLPTIIDLLQRILLSIDRALLLGGLAIIILMAWLVFQLIFMHATITRMRYELTSLRAFINESVSKGLHTTATMNTTTSSECMVLS